MKNYLLLFGLMLFICGCTEEKPFTVGEINGSVYTNSYFGLTLKVPDGWMIADKALVEKTKKINFKNNELNKGIKPDALKKAGEISEFLIIAEKTGNNGKRLVNLNITAAKMDIFTEDNWKGEVRNLIDVSSTSVSYCRQIGKTTERNVSGVQFLNACLRVQIGRVAYTSHVLYTFIKGYLLMISVSCFESSQEFEVEKLISSIKFE